MAMKTHTGYQLEVNHKKVPSVQEMAKKKLVRIPSRYVRDDQERSVASSNREVPVSDMQRLINSNDHDDSINIELQKLHFAAKEWGFFQLINHGVSCSVVEKMKHEIQKFFDLPLEEKKKFEILPGDTDGFGQHFVVSDEQKLDWADLFALKTAPPYLRRPIFSKLFLSFRATIEEYSEEVKELTMKVLKMLGKAVGIEEEEVKSLFEEGMQSMRMNYYPPCPQPELVMGLSPHSDASALTILLQVNETEGLQVRKYGIWIPIIPLPNAFIVNIGDVFEIFSNGRYRSIEHRSVVSSEKERISVATFHGPRLDGELGPANSLVTAHGQPAFKKIGVHEFYTRFFNRELVGKTYVDTMRITSTEDDLKNAS
ncbi:protein SRG1 [Capsicum chacoense]